MIQANRNKVICHHCKWYCSKDNRCTKLNARTFEYRVRECNLYKPKIDNHEQKES